MDDGSQRMNLVLPQKIHEKLSEIQEKTGLSKSEITRQGILSEIDRLKQRLD